ncbi:MULTISPECIES: TetR/AcrR family transcriptional regulator [unclassified Pseudonocardia]|uniref:TetR/AcrR family transcriptional regulator n=1 Tax=unclassified Pseudonocardia TaxID=2619320 RepID=UPI000969A062|nr:MULTISPECIES: TetR/AcrR family transcriptional regulator [unclassified Pseudonocardia]MBN9096613.1 TetR/AcrR family transcriptional regulator [Pseudonocardia sp.]OJY43777.1 MAG: hypothetical protein BGP03_07680 [Pseudonocardia sp. 73-21]
MPQGGSLARTHDAEPGLPRGRSSLPASEVAAAQRLRLITATVSVVAGSGFRAATVADIVRAAKVSRAAFYQHFADKDACLRAASAHGWGLLVTAIRTATRELPPGTEPEVELRAGLRAYLHFLAAEPAFTRIFYVEMPGAGPEAWPDIEAAQRQFAEVNRAWHEHALPRRPGWPRVPFEAYLAVGGATTQLVRTCVREDRTAELPELEDTLVALHLAVLAARPWE